jgi:hypothetical protein
VTGTWGHSWPSRSTLVFRWPSRLVPIRPALVVESNFAMAIRYRPSLLTFLILLPIAAQAAFSEDLAYAWRLSDNQDGSSLVLGSAEPRDDFVFLLSCSDANRINEMAIYVDIGSAKVGQPVKIELSRDGAKAYVKGRTTVDKSGFIFAEAQNFPVKPLLSVLDGEGPVKIITGRTVTLLPDEGRAAGLAEFASRCSPD